MSKKVELKISVFKDCGTCKHIKFLNDWATAKCLLSNNIVIENAFDSNRKEKEPCEKWEFNYKLLEEAECGFIDLKETKKINKKAFL